MAPAELVSRQQISIPRFEQQMPRPGDQLLVLERPIMPGLPQLHSFVIVLNMRYFRARGTGIFGLSEARTKSGFSRDVAPFRLLSLPTWLSDCSILVPLIIISPETGGPIFNV